VEKEEEEDGKWACTAINMPVREANDNYWKLEVQ